MKLQKVLNKHLVVEETWYTIETSSNLAVFSAKPEVHKHTGSCFGFCPVNVSMWSGGSGSERQRRVGGIGGLT